MRLGLKFFLFGFSIIFLTSIVSFGQTIISLKDCINLAEKNNPQISLAAFEKEKSKIQLNTAKAAWHPTLNANIQTSSNWGLYIDPSTNLLSRSNNIGNQANIASSWTLFNGFANHYSIKSKQQALTSAQLIYEKTLKDLRLQVTLNYLNLLFCKEQFKNAKERKSQIEKQRKNIQALVENGVLHKRDLLNIDYQLANVENFLSTSEQELEQARFLLLQIIGLKTADTVEFQILGNPSMNDSITYHDTLSFAAFCEQAKLFLPEIQFAKSKIKEAEYNLKVVKASTFPTINLRANAGTRTSSMQMEYYEDQLLLNQNQRLSLGIQIPIYNKKINRNNISLAKLDQLIELENFEVANMQLEQELLQIYMDYKTVIKKYNTLKQQFSLISEELRYAEKLFEIGGITILEYSETRTRFNVAQSELLQAKYDYIFKQKLIDLYQGKPIE